MIIVNMIPFARSIEQFSRPRSRCQMADATSNGIASCPPPATHPILQQKEHVSIMTLETPKNKCAPQ